MIFTNSCYSDVSLGATSLLFAPVGVFIDLLNNNKNRQKLKSVEMFLNDIFVFKGQTKPTLPH
jgi:hypothetical protein